MALNVYLVKHPFKQEPIMSLFRRITIHRNFEIILYTLNVLGACSLVNSCSRHLENPLNPFKVREKQTWPWPSSLPLPAHWHQRWPQHLPGRLPPCVLGKVEGRDLLGLLNLLLVGLHLALQLVNEGLHPLVVLPVLVSGKAQLLD